MLGIFLFCIYLLVFSFIFSRSRSRKWWVKIVTQVPDCLYYFGPFDSAQEAQRHQSGYLEDLEEEGSFGFTVQIQQCQPQQLTVFEEFSDGASETMPSELTT